MLKKTTVLPQIRRRRIEQDCLSRTAASFTQIVVYVYSPVEKMCIAITLNRCTRTHIHRLLAGAGVWTSGALPAGLPRASLAGTYFPPSLPPSLPPSSPPSLPSSHPRPLPSTHIPACRPRCPSAIKA